MKREKFRERMSLIHENLIQFIDYEKIEDNFMCGNFNKLLIYYEYHHHDLFKEIISRRKDNVKKIKFSFLFF